MLNVIFCVISSSITSSFIYLFMLVAQVRAMKPYIESVSKRFFFLQIWSIAHKTLVSVYLIHRLCSCHFHLMRFSRSSRREVFCKKGVLRNFRKFTGKYLCQSLFFNKVAGMMLKMRLWHRCFPVKFVKFLRINFYI